MKLFNVIDTTFENFDSTVRNYLSKTFDDLGLNYTSSQIFGVVFDGMKGIMQNVMFYLEDAMTEQNIFTATRKRSFYSLAKLSGYEPYYGSAATGTLIVTSFVNNLTPSDRTTKVFIRNHSLLMNDTTGVSYTLILPSDDYVIDISKPLMKHYLKIAQGVWTSAHFQAKGDLYETFQVTSAALHDKQYIKVTVNGEEYSQAACLYDMVENSKEYLISSGFDGQFEISFGNGVHGKPVEKGDTVVVEFLTHDGSNGNIISPGSEKFRMMSPCYNVAGNAIAADDYMAFSLDEPVTGGTDADSIDLVKSMIGYNSRSLVLASEDNFKQFLKRFSFIGRTSIYTEPSSMTVTAGCLTNVIDKLQDLDDYLDIDEQDLLLTDEQKNMISLAIANSNKVFAGIKFKFLDPVIRKYSAICYVKLKEAYARDVAKMNIRNAIAKYFINLPENTTFIPKSDIIKACLDEDNNIESFDIDFISSLNEQAYYDGWYYKYQKRLINGVYKYVPIKTIYDSYSVAGLDDYGNIKLDSTVEIPLLHGGFNYYPNKAEQDKSDSIRMESLQILFI